MNLDEAIEARTSYSTEMFSNDLQFDVHEELISSIRKFIPTILYGPPGTGKTKLVLDCMAELRDLGILGAQDSVQFHKKFSYEDFIEGYSPSPEGGFVEKSGIFKSFCEKDCIDQEKVHLFLIDEINRADLASTFGEVLFALEDREQRNVKTAHFGKILQIPRNLSIVGTMNTADKNIAHIDFAIRRRFKFIPVYPSKVALQLWLYKVGFAFTDFSINDYLVLFEKINERISVHPLLGPHMQLGKALFVPKRSSSSMDCISMDEIRQNFAEAVLPQVEAYFGFGGNKELSSIFNSLIVSRYIKHRSVQTPEFVALIKEVVNEQ